MAPYAKGLTKGASRKPYSKNKKSSTSFKAKLIKSIVGAEKRGPELKCVDFYGAGVAPQIQLISSSAPSITLVNGCAVGTNFNNRIGRSIHMKSLRIRGAIFPSGNAGTTAGEYLSIYCVYDRQTNGAAPIYPDIFQSVDSGGGGNNAVFDFPNLNNSERFIVLWEEHLQVANTAAAAANNAQSDNIQDQTIMHQYDKYIKLNDLPINFSTTGDGVADVASGALFIVTCGSQTAASAGCTFNYVTRLRYTDA